MSLSSLACPMTCAGLPAQPFLSFAASSGLGATDVTDLDSDWGTSPFVSHTWGEAKQMDFYVKRGVNLRVLKQLYYLRVRIQNSKGALGLVCVSGAFLVGIVMKIAFELEQVHHFAATGQ